LRIAKALGTTARFWLNLQKDFEFESAKAAIGASLADIKPIHKAAA
jgi:plasmid maintenance system antidote protein VapI